MEIVQSDLSLLQNKLASQLRPNQAYNQLDNADKFEINEQLLQNIGQSTQKLNEMLFPLLWECYITGNWIGDPLFAFRDWVEDEILPFYPKDQRNYIQKMIFGTKFVLTTVYVKEKAGTPIVDDNGELVTVERLLEQPSKVTDYAYHISKQPEPEMFIAKLTTNTHAQLNKLRNEDDISSALPIVTADAFYCQEGGYEIRIRIPDLRTLNLIERLLKPIVRFSLIKGA